MIVPHGSRPSVDVVDTIFWLLAKRARAGASKLENVVLPIDQAKID